MGLLMSKLMDSLRAIEDKRILMLGLDAAGKTTMLYKMRLGENITTVPTIGFNTETIETSRRQRFQMWDVGGQDKIRALWRHYYVGTHALIFVVDSNDRMRMEEARETLMKTLSDPDMPEDAAVLVFANKQDLPNALSATEICEKLGLKNDHLLRTRSWFIQSCVATSGEGVYEGIDWLSRTLRGI